MPGGRLERKEIDMSHRARILTSDRGRFIAVALAPLALHTAIAQPQSITSPIQLDGTSCDAKETSIAANNGNRIVACWNDNCPGAATRLGTSISLDGGATWTLGSVPAILGDPATACDKRNGTLWVGGDSAQGNIAVARLNSAGT